MTFLRKLDRVLFVVLAVGVGILTWNAFQKYPERQRERSYIQTFGDSLNTRRVTLGLRPVLPTDRVTVSTDSVGTTRINWLPEKEGSVSQAHFWKKEVIIRYDQRIQETDSYYYPISKTKYQLLHFDYLPRQQPNRQFRARLMVEGLPTISSFEIPNAYTARTFKDSLLLEWNIRTK